MGGVSYIFGFNQTAVYKSHKICWSLFPFISKLGQLIYKKDSCYEQSKYNFFK